MQEVEVTKKLVLIVAEDGTVERRYAEVQAGVRRDNGDWIGSPTLEPRELTADEYLAAAQLPFKSTEDAERSARLSAESSLRSAQQRITSLEQSLDKGDTLLEKADEDNATLRARVAELEAREAAVKAAVS